VTGRFAPSPTGALHLGNLRTAFAAWLSARASGHALLVRMEDLDRQQSSERHERSQLAELAAVGLDWDGEVVRQSDRFELYDQAINRLAARGLVYECFCTRREIQAEIAASVAAPHGPAGSYPGTCRDLSETDRAAHRSAGRTAALRLRTDGRSMTVIDRLAGQYTSPVDDVVLRRNDGVPAYNLAVVVDDAAQGVTEVVRGDDLLSSTPRQLLLQELLELPRPGYAHVPLVMGADGQRLAKRHGAVTLEELAVAGVAPSQAVSWIGASLGLNELGARVSSYDLVERFDWASVPCSPIGQPTLAELLGHTGRPNG
jgi:glutamyl-tRNA synthetase